MNYFLLNLVFTLIAGLLIWARRTSISFKTSFISFSWLAILTLIMDNLIIWAGIVDYDQSKISGLKLALAPVEDFGYLLVAVFLVPVIWSLVEGDAGEQSKR